MTNFDRKLLAAYAAGASDERDLGTDLANGSLVRTDDGEGADPYPAVTIEALRARIAGL